MRRRGREGWLLGVDPGPSLGGTRPSPEKLAWLVDRIVEHRGALPIILSGSATKECRDQLKRHMKCEPLEASLRGIRDVLSFTKCCDVILSGNTDLFHLAVALEVPTVGLFGREEESRWYPDERPTTRVLRLRPGDRILEREFLAVLDEIRHAGIVDLPGLAGDVDDEGPEEAPSEASDALDLRRA
jgi:ADP-heptose:LPS heptosyltransferase